MQKGLYCGRLAMLNCEVKRGITVMVLCIGVEVEVGDRVREEFGIRITGEIMQEVTAFAVGEIGIGAECDESFYHLDIAVFGGDHEGCDAIMIL